MTAPPPVQRFTDIWSDMGTHQNGPSVDVRLSKMAQQRSENPSAWESLALAIQGLQESHTDALQDTFVAIQLDYIKPFLSVKTSMESIQQRPHIRSEMARFYHQVHENLLHVVDLMMEAGAGFWVAHTTSGERKALDTLLSQWNNCSLDQQRIDAPLYDELLRRVFDELDDHPDRWESWLEHERQQAQSWNYQLPKIWQDSLRLLPFMSDEVQERWFQRWEGWCKAILHPTPPYSMSTHWGSLVSPFWWRQDWSYEEAKTLLSTVTNEFLPSTWVSELGFCAPIRMPSWGRQKWGRLWCQEGLGKAWDEEMMQDLQDLARSPEFHVTQAPEIQSEMQEAHRYAWLSLNPRDPEERALLGLNLKRQGFYTWESWVSSLSPEDVLHARYPVAWLEAMDQQGLSFNLDLAEGRTSIRRSDLFVSLMPEVLIAAMPSHEKVQAGLRVMKAKSFSPEAIEQLMAWMTQQPQERWGQWEKLRQHHVPLKINEELGPWLNVLSRPLSHYNDRLEALGEVFTRAWWPEQLHEPLDLRTCSPVPRLDTEATSHEPVPAGALPWEKVDGLPSMKMALWSLLLSSSWMPEVGHELGFQPTIREKKALGEKKMSFYLATCMQQSWQAQQVDATPGLSKRRF